MTAKPKPAMKPQTMKVVVGTEPDMQAIEIRRVALEFAVGAGAKTTDIVPVAAKIEEYIRNGQAKS